MNTTYRTLQFAGNCLMTVLALAFAPHALADGNPATDNSTPDSAAAAGALAVARSGAPIKDAQGRIRYIIDLEEDDSGKPNQFADANHKIGWHKARSGQ